MTAPLAGTRGWRIGNSLWLLPLFCCGLLTWTSFLYIGARTRNRVWLISGAVYLIATIAVFVLIAKSGPSTSDVAAGATPPTSGQKAMSDWGAGLMLAMWLAGIVQGLLARPHYLHTLHLAQPQPVLVPQYGQAAPAVAAPAWTGLDPNAYWAPQHTGSASAPPAAVPSAYAAPPVPSVPPVLGPPAGSSATPADAVPPNVVPADSPKRTGLPPQHTPPPVSARSRIAVNTAGAAEFVTLGLSERAIAAVLAARERGGGFRDLREFTAAAELKPHELRQISDRLDFSGAASHVAPVAGRRLDL